MTVPLDLTRKEQDIIALVAAELRTVLYQCLTNQDADWSRMEALVERLAAMGVTPQELDTIFDKAHRTGHNS